MSQIKIRKLDGVWLVRAGGGVLGESKSALALSEPGYDDVIYFPREDMAMAFLDPSDHTSHCPHKGDASYFSIVAKSRTFENAVWSYETPNSEVARIAGHLAFHTSEFVKVERL